MIKKALIFFSFIFCLYVPLKSQSQYAITTAQHSLRLREAPSTKSKIIFKIPCHSAVIIIKNNIKEMEINKVKGAWCKVNYYNGSNQNEIVGYVFDAYLNKNTNNFFHKLIIKEDKILRKNKLYFKRNHQFFRSFNLKLENGKYKKITDPSITPFLYDYDKKSGFYILYAIEGGESHFMMFVDTKDGQIYNVHGDYPFYYNNKKSRMLCSYYSDYGPTFQLNLYATKNKSIKLIKGWHFHELLYENVRKIEVKKIQWVNDSNIEAIMLFSLSQNNGKNIQTTKKIILYNKKGIWFMKPQLHNLKKLLQAK